MPDESLLVLEDGSGLANANAYTTAAAMLAYFTPQGVDLTTWTTQRMEQRIILATNYMVARYRRMWQGRRINYVQALDWPRYGVLLSLGDDVDLWFPGYGPGFATADSVFPQNMVPKEVAMACAELAYRADLGTDGASTNGGGVLLPDLQPEDTQVIRETIGPITTAWTPGRSPLPVYTFVNSILQPFMKAGASQTRLIRG